MTSGRISSPSLSDAPLIVPWINRALEFLWLAAAVLVPIAFIDRDYAVSEAVIAYVEVPKIALLRTIAGLMTILWLLEWAIQGSSSSRLFSALIRPSKTQALVLLPELRIWLWNQPARWLMLAVWLFLGSTVITTVLSGSFQTSLWGEIPGQDGYAAYTVASYVLLFAVVVTHLKTKPQVVRLIAALVGVGVLVAGYAVLQHYGHDFLDLTEQTGGGRLRVTSFMGNAIFSAAVMSMTIPITLMASVVTFMEPAPLRGRVGSNLKQWLLASGLTTGWGVILAVQLLGIAFTLSRGPWLGTALSLAIFLGLALLFVGRSAFGRGALVLGLAAVFALAVLQWQGSTSILGVGPWAGALLALSGLAGAGVVNANWRFFNQLVLILGAALIVVAVGVSGPSGLKDIGGFMGDQSPPSGSPVSDTATQLGERFSSIGTEVLSGGRSTHWRVSWMLIRERPWFAFDHLSLPWLRTLIGYGPDLFRFTYLLRSPAEGADVQPLEPDHAHNYFIHQTVEQGILGLFSSVGIFLAALLASGYLLLRERIQSPALATLLIIGLSSTLAGRALEMSVGVARVSDLTTLWVVLALLASLIAWMRNPEAMGGVKPQPKPGLRRAARSPRRTRMTTTSNRPRNLQLFWRLAIVAWLVGGIGVLTWVKGVNYVRAAVEEGQAVREFRRGEFEASLTSLDRAIDLAPDVPAYHTNRAQLFLNYLVSKNVTPEQGCSLPGGPPYEVCLATESFRSNLLGVIQRPFYYRSRLASANSAGLFPLNEEAIKLYSEGLSLLPNSWMIRNLLAKTYLRTGDPEAARQHLLESLRITDGDRNSAEALYLLGVAYRDLGDLENSATAMERALVWQSRASWAAESMEIIDQYYSSLGGEATLTRLNEALFRNPEDSVAYYNRGQIFIQMELFDQAYKDFNRSIELGFSWPGVLAARGRVSNILGIPWATALRDLNTAVKLDPQNARYYAYRGDVNRTGGRMWVARQDLEQALLLDPKLPLAHYFRGLLLHDLGLYQKAIEDFDHAISLDSGMADANKGRAESDRQLEALAKMGLATRAYEELSRDYSPEFSEAGFFAWRGRAAQLIGTHGDAARFLTHAIRLDPKNASYYAYRGDVNRSGGLISAAGKDLEQALLLDPNLSLAYYFRGLLLHDLDQNKEAIIDLNQAIELSPQLPEAYVLRGRTLQALGREEEADQDMGTAERLNGG